MNENNNELPLSSPPQYASLGIDPIAISKANDSLEEQRAICRFMLNKYNNRKKNQDESDNQKLLVYLHWKMEVTEKLLTNQ